MVFQLTPGTEAPVRDEHLLSAVPRCSTSRRTSTHTMHNLYTLRGAEIRDAIAWSAYIEQTRELFAEQVRRDDRPAPLAEVGSARTSTACCASSAISTSTSMTSRCGCMNQGYTPREIAAQLQAPAEPRPTNGRRAAITGRVSHNTKAVYQKYLGWYDANPANLEPAAAGGIGAALRRVHGRRECRHRAGAEGFHERQLSLGR